MIKRVALFIATNLAVLLVLSVGMLFLTQFARLRLQLEAIVDECDANFDSRQLDEALARLEALEARLVADGDELRVATAAWLDEVLIVARNRRMLERLDARLEQQRLLVAVGAMHLVGETGLIEGLRRLGYRIARSGE